MPPPLIVTLKISEPAYAYFNSLRHRYYPAALNIVPAHVSLFHNLPGEELNSIRCSLRTLCTQTPALALSAIAPRLLGNGISIAVEGKTLLTCQKQLSVLWNEWLTPQDRQGYRPHITIQNKVSKEHALDSFAQIEKTFLPVVFTGDGINLWSYLNGLWGFVDSFPFAPAEPRL